ncbi:MAG: hypothetical protein ACOYIG_13010, partial [Acetivibrionales bacterium]
MKASRVGGFSMPSIAITKPEISFQQYGEITLIGNKDMIDPKIKANKVYGADAYTTRYPSISYEVKNTKPIKEIVSKMPVSNSIVYELVYDINNDGDAYLYENRNIRLMFAHQKGADIFKTVETDIAKPVIDFVREVEGYDHLSIRDNDDVKTKLGKIIADNLSDKHKKIYERAGLLENGVASEKLINDTFDAAKEYIRKEGQVDVYQAYINAREYITNNNLEGEIKRFARDLYEQLDVTERIFKGYTKNGTPRYVPHTLENALKEMKANKGVGIEGLSGNFGQLRARLVPEFKSIKGIKDKAHKLADNRASEEEYNKVLEQYYEISGKLEKYHKWGDDWLETRRSFNDEIVSLVRNGESESFKNLPKDLQEEIKTFAANVENIPTDYFEAKPERVIALSEFNSAVVPEGTDQKVIDLLNNSGVEVHEYADNNRMEVIQDVSRKNDLMFRAVGEIGASRALDQPNQELPTTINIDGIERSTTNSEGKPIAQTEEGIRNFWRWFGDSKVVDAEGRPLVVYHGTNKEFNSFKEGTQYFTVDKNEASGYAKERSNGLDKGTPNIISAYLKIVNPAKDDDIIAAAEQAGVDPDSDITSALANIKEVKAILEKRGFDGIGPVLDLGFESDFDEFETYATFNANQIKSATNNTGTFDPNNNDIRFRALKQPNQELPTTINIDGIERSTTNSEGKYIAQTEEGVRNFWKWFGDSKVVDEQGRPLVVYHGTSNDIDDVKKEFRSGYFTDSKSGAELFGDVISAYLNIRNAKAIDFNGGDYNSYPIGFTDQNGDFYEFNPYVEDIEFDEFLNRHLSEYDMDESDVNIEYGGDQGFSDGSSDILIALAELTGKYDGAIFKNVAMTGNNYIPFSPNQIKSVDNTGAFDPNNNDIRFRHEDSKDVTLFKYGEGGTKGVFTDSKGNLYKSLTRQENVYDNETKSFGKRDVPGETNEYEILKELQDNRNIVKVRNKVDTKQGPMFEMETLNEVD